MSRLFAVGVLLLIFGCKSTSEQLKDEGYTNIVPAESGTCPTDDPVLREAFRADRDSKTWEISTCCHYWWAPLRIGKVTYIHRYESCSRYAREDGP